MVKAQQSSFSTDGVAACGISARISPLPLMTKSSAASQALWAYIYSYNLWVIFTMAEEIINLKFIFRELSDVSSCLQWCRRIGLITDSYECPKCKRGMTLFDRKDISDGQMWRCRVGHAEMKRSIRRNSWFALSRMSLFDILLLTELWLMRVPAMEIIREVEVATKTVYDWISLCREVCLSSCELESEIIGGPESIVDIHECKFGKQKYNTGESLEEKWIIAGLERETKKCFIEIVPNKSKDIFLRVLKKYVIPETTIYSDCWQAYDCVNEALEHYTVNQTIHFKHPQKGYTNFIEGSTPDNVQTYLGEYIWRRKYDSDKNITRRFMEAIIRVHKPITRDKE